nr:MAG TPA: hypothetical protein [Caudoviricetes sp.]
MSRVILYHLELVLSGWLFLFTIAVKSPIWF